MEINLGEIVNLFSLLIESGMPDLASFIHETFLDAQQSASHNFAQ